MRAYLNLSLGQPPRVLEMGKEQIEIRVRDLGSSHQFAQFFLLEGESILLLGPFQQLVSLSLQECNVYYFILVVVLVGVLRAH